MATRQIERSERSERALVEAAVDLIAERGYDGATLAAIGEAAGYSRGLITQRFGSKEALLWNVVEQLMVGWGERLLRPAVGTATGLEALRRVVAAYADAVRFRPKQVRCLNVLLVEAAGPLPALRPKFAELHRQQDAAVEAILRAGVVAGSVRRDVDPTRQAAVFNATLRGLTLQWLIDPEHVDLPSVLDEYARSLGRLLAP